ncbi:hypothetical protein HEK616_05880 [Streptomyces nigrescens]|uniref:Uncharacterized protein n=1 Tax=Streptomyces nigrescens TaxID=1920 RepID=A0ABN6QQF0_STRNI|nr:hypothetical protein HEK616_05880 [Streptomyces nigrescens]
MAIAVFLDLVRVEELTVDGEKLEQFRQVSRDDVKVSFVAHQDDGQGGEVGSVVAPPQGVMRAGVGGIREGDEPLQKLRRIRPARRGPRRRTDGDGGR